MRAAYVCLVATAAACGSSSPQPPARGSATTVGPRQTSWPAVLSISDDSACFTRNGLAYCWGDNSMSQLADGTQRSRDEAAPAAGLTDAVDVVAMTGQACALRRTGAVVCWGVDQPPAPVLDDAVRLDAYDRAVCVARRDATVWCWGYSPTGTHGQRADMVEAPAAIDGVTGAEDVATTYDRACALLRDGTVVCWGRAHEQATGSPAPSPLPGATDVDAIWGGGSQLCVRRRSGEVACVLGGDHGTALVPIDEWKDARSVAISVAGGLCALGADGRVSCFGGVGASSQWWIELDDTRPRHIPDTEGVIALAASQRLCVLDAEGRPRCRGTNIRYRLQPVAGIDDGVALVGGTNGTCALRRNQEVWCWGAFNTLTWRKPAPARVPALSDPAAIAIGDDVCAIDRAAQLSCGHGRGRPATPVLTDATQLAIDNLHGCAVRRDGRVACWNRDGKAALVDGLADAVEVAPGGQFACARRRSGAVHCWGEKAAEKLTDSGVADAVQLVATRDFACARRRTGGVVCWGAVPAPVTGKIYAAFRERHELPGITDAIDVAASSGGVCVVRRGGQLVCGHYLAARDASDPVLVPAPDIADAVDVAVGERHVCALRRTGAIACFGADTHGAVGDGAAQRFTPVPLLR